MITNNVIADAELDKRFPPQIVAEMRELAAAPAIPSAGLLGRCHFCGAVTNETVYVETINGIERRRGVDCCGGGRFTLKG